MKNIILIHGDKGGTGKTHVAQMTAAVLRSVGHPVTLIDGDAKNPGLYRSFNEKPDPVLRINARRSEGIDALLETYLATDQDILVDLPAGGSDTTRAFTGTGAAAGTVDIEALLQETDGRLVVMFVIDQSRDSLVALADELARLPRAVSDWLVVRNHRTDHTFERFDRWIGDSAPRQLCSLDMPALDRRVIEALVDAKKHFGEIDHVEHASALMKMRAKSALRQWTAQLKKAGLIDD
ncbi:hypothetical protein [Roseinatronobacter sp.]|uniref:hypothetical protein n=1 Tax=Roseinatronobacter sp. TaxID=1945755 RepID=UPI003F71E457